MQEDVNDMQSAGASNITCGLLMGPVKPLCCIAFSTINSILVLAALAWGKLL
jgi:hypothetical protein